MRDLEIIRSKHGFISDMDGVIYQGSQLLPGVKEFVDWLRKEKSSFSSSPTPANAHLLNSTKSSLPWGLTSMNPTFTQAPWQQLNS